MYVHRLHVDYKKLVLALKISHKFSVSQLKSVIYCTLHRVSFLIWTVWVTIIKCTYRCTPYDQIIIIMTNIMLNALFIGSEFRCSYRIYVSA